MTHLRTDHQPVRSDRACSECIVVRRPSEADIPALAEIFAEMQRHYRKPVSDAAATAAASLACMPPMGAFDPHTLIALAGMELVGSLVMNVSFPASELTRSLYIRDLYVARTMRRRGVGTAMVKAAARVALDLGFSALEWTTDAANVAARAMYEECGAIWLDRTYYRLFGDALERAAG
jgi:GNAT superfamily N-acetyltransferase